MRAPWPLLLAVVVNGCTCRGEQPRATPEVADTAPPSGLEHDLELRRTALIAFGNSTPLPVSEDFSEEVPQVAPALERATKQRANQPLRMRVARDVPYAQVTRLMQAALGFRVLQWELQIEDITGTLRAVPIKAPSPTPRGDCWARAWVGPDERVLVGVDLGADATSNGMTGILVSPKDGRAQPSLVVDALRRADAHCEKGQFRVYSQPTARVGPAFDIAYAVSMASARPKINDLVFAVPSVGPLDTIVEVVK